MSKNCTTALLLLAYIGVLMALNLLTPDRLFSDSENRVLEQRPQFSWDDLVQGRFTRSYEKYIADQFALRDFWIGVRSDAERLFGKRESNGVYLGRDGFLLQKFDQPGSGEFRQRIRAVNSLAASLPGVRKYLLLAPTSVAIMADKLPPDAPVASERLTLNRVKQALDPGIRYVDVYPVLYSHRDEYIYYKTDHHWTTLGAYYAYVRLCGDLGLEPHAPDYFRVARVTGSFYGSLYSRGGFRHLQPDTIELYYPRSPERYRINYFDYNQVSHSLYALSNLKKKDKYSVFLNGNQSLVKISTGLKNGRKLAIVKDSYALSLIPFLTGHYQEIYVVDPRYYRDSLQTLVKTHGIGELLLLYNVNTFFEDPSILALV